MSYFASNQCASVHSPVEACWLTSVNSGEAEDGSQQAALGREKLYLLTLNLLEELPAGMAEADQQTLIEEAVHTRKAFSEAASRAGGRWQLGDRRLVFVPWHAVPKEEKAGVLISEQLEQIIVEVSKSSSSVYAAWSAVRLRCVAQGINYPSLISLYQRIEARREREAQF